MITISKTAADEVNKILVEQKETLGKEEKDKDFYLRVGVVGGGCSGFKQTLDITSDKGELDEEFDQHGIIVICDSKSHIYLDGTTIDFKSTTMGSGFVFEIPLSTGSCGCGSSFQT